MLIHQSMEQECLKTSVQGRPQFALSFEIFNQFNIQHMAMVHLSLSFLPPTDSAINLANSLIQSQEKVVVPSSRSSL